MDIFCVWKHYGIRKKRLWSGNCNNGKVDEPYLMFTTVDAWTIGNLKLKLTLSFPDSHENIIPIEKRRRNIIFEIFQSINNRKQKGGNVRWKLTFLLWKWLINEKKNQQLFSKRQTNKTESFQNHLYDLKQ